MEDERICDDVSKGFADLTALLEDAAGLAVEGQSRRCTVIPLDCRGVPLMAFAEQVQQSARYWPGPAMFHQRWVKYMRGKLGVVLWLTMGLKR